MGLKGMSGVPGLGGRITGGGLGGVAGVAGVGGVTGVAGVAVPGILGNGPGFAMAGATALGAAAAGFFTVVESLGTVVAASANGENAK
ncbi:hypothetical protein KBD59_02240 [Candidatus Gracilibacteria bacterium]|nr:hypothetical protein [Candidatus Gracilibacteria bacterium]